jgi:hypothetical protein
LGIENKTTERMTLSDIFNFEHSNNSNNSNNSKRKAIGF